MQKRVVASAFAILVALCSLLPATVLAAAFPSAETPLSYASIRLVDTTPKPKIYDPERDMWQELGTDGWSRWIDTPLSKPIPEGDTLWTSVPEGEVCSRCGSPLVLDTYRFRGGWVTTSFSLCPRNPNFNDKVQERRIYQNIFCTNEEECGLLYDKQFFVDHRTLCEH